MPGDDRFIEIQQPARRRWRWWQITLLTVGALVLVGVTAAAGVIWHFSQDLPSLDLLQSYQPSLVTTVYSDDRQPIGQFFIERRILTPLADIPDSLKQAVIATEDARFFEHPGLDYIGILRAAWTNIRHGGRKVEGASTITQQLARSLFLSAERSYDRKIRELILAYKMEAVSSKEQILETYLNQIYFGQGAYGVASAAQSYFGKDITTLTLAESAFLAGLPKSPSRFSPFTAYERAKKRQEHVLSRMEEAGFITAAEREAAAAEALNFHRPGSEHFAPYFVEYVRQLLVAKYGETMVYKGGMQVYTTLNLEMQKAAEAAFAAGVRELDKREGWRGPKRTVDIGMLQPPAAASTDGTLKPGDLAEGIVLKAGKDHYAVLVGSVTAKLSFDDMAWAKRQLRGPDPAVDFVVNPNLKQILKPGDVIDVAVKKATKEGLTLTLEQTPIVEGGLIALDPRTGAIRAMVGGYDFSRSEYNRAVQAHRQPGSAFKPLIYATAMSQGMSPATQILDAPVVYEQEEDDKIWKPENYGRKFHGMVSLRDALAHSHNLATVRLLDKVGIRNVIDFSRTVGITSPLPADLSLGLGSSSVGLMELTSVYGVFLNKGSKAEPFAIKAAQDNTGKVLETTEPEPREVISKETAYLITNMMEDVVQKGTGQAAKSLDRPIAGKTGTTNDYINAWFIGGTPNLVTGVYVGFDDRRSLGESETGARAALPIWLAFMKEALKQLPVVPFEIPDGVTFVKVDASTGLLESDQEGEGDKGTVELFTKGSEPTQAAQRRLDPTDFYKLDQIPEGQPVGEGSL
ncbi:penicillin-binding protein 1A [Nitrospira moscoviensis]|uniref:Penicillin-binding protein 1A n=1 Tax=Nitrospira moscoviensis TaxID=42253 RepID=A0A0K2GID9_NITMO|nr:PBP1A family penicillin-binding protein [Nitrospira moscoviensis]ALA60701.1 Penicillin-binding protein 1A [Nitrospira moscoviensis]